MKVIKDCYESIGMFDSRVGDILIYNQLMIIPVSNIQVDNTSGLNDTDYIHIYNYAYFILDKVSISRRDVFFRNEVFNQELYRDDNAISYNTYDFELIDFRNPEYQYWNWIIKANSFSLGIPEYASSRKEYFENDKLEKSHFYIKDFDFLNMNSSK